MKAVALVLAAAVALPGASQAASPTTATASGPDWRGMATRDDLRRMRMWREAFVEGLAQARAAGHGSAIEAEGKLLDPDAAIDGGSLPAGDYRCRTIKLGNPGGVGGALLSYAPFRCRITVDGQAVRFEKLTGSQRPAGRLYPGGLRRQVFLGTLVLGDETRALGYGRDAQRDMIGAVERIGARQWRLIMPYPRFESTFDVVELVSAN